MTRLSSNALSADASRGRGEAQIDGPGVASASSTDASSGSTAWTAAARCRSRTIGSSSRSSMEIHAKGRGSRASHCASKVVLPYPAGAVIITTGKAMLALRRLTRAVRETVPERRTGMWSFDSTISNGSFAARRMRGRGRCSAARPSGRGSGAGTLISGPHLKASPEAPTHCLGTSDTRPAPLGQRRRNRTRRSGARNGARCVWPGARSEASGIPRRPGRSHALSEPRRGRYPGRCSAYGDCAEGPRGASDPTLLLPPCCGSAELRF